LKALKIKGFKAYYFLKSEQKIRVKNSLYRKYFCSSYENDPLFSIEIIDIFRHKFSFFSWQDKNKYL